MGVPVGHFAGVRRLWLYLPGAQPGHQKPDYSRHRRPALGNLSCCTALVPPEVQRNVLSEATVSSLHSIGRDHGVVYGRGRAGAGLARDSWIADLVLGDSGLCLLAHEKDGDQLSSGLRMSVTNR